MTMLNRGPWAVIVAAALLFGTASSVWADADAWRLRLLPLPQQLRLGPTLAAPSMEMTLHLPERKSDMWPLIAEELGGLVGKDKLRVVNDLPSMALVLSARADAKAAAAKFSGDRARLARRPNPDQAYALHIVGDGGKWAAAVVVARAEPGLFFGYKTLKQLLEATTGPKPVAPRLSLPEAEIVDWPDMPERGEWGSYALRDIDWLVDRKMNLIETHATLSFDESGRAHATFPVETLKQGARRGMKIVPIITHLDQLERRGIFKYHPEVRGQGKEEDFKHWGTTLVPVCWAKPQAVRIMTQWMEDLARIPGVTAITVWLSEDHSYCHCPVCTKNGQFVMETRAAIAAWRAARKIKPDLELRILLTQGSYKFNEDVLKEIPVGEPVHVIYYHGSLTYNAFKRDMIEPYMADFAKRAGWFGVCPMLGPSWRIVSPFSCPQFIHERMMEFHAKGIKCIYGYATPGNLWWDLNVNGVAEWAWNRDGRDIREFCRAWGARRGLDPDLTAEWALTLGPASWDFYAARVPYTWFFGDLVAQLRKGARFDYGEGFLEYIPTQAHMQADLRRAREAEAIAKKLGAADLIAESRAVGGYLEMLRLCRDISHAIAKARAAKPKPSDDQKARMSRLMAELDRVSAELTAALGDWAKAIAAADKSKPPGRFLDTVAQIEKTVSGIGEICAQFGIKDPGRVYRWHKIGEWKTEDFDKQSPLTRRIEVTQWIDGPGTYEVRFSYRSGRLGLVVTKVSLVSRSPDGEEKVEAVDEHRCHAGAWADRPSYMLKLDKYQAGRKYLVEMVISGGNPKAPRSKRSTNGDIMMRKLRQ